MSNYFKTAAMSLLSKTLQTFLSKYLEDVDVEGVALPSLGDASSGWGVRLSNVQLRSGVPLLAKLPGSGCKVQRPAKRRRKKRSKAQQATGQEEAPPMTVREDSDSSSRSMSVQEWNTEENRSHGAKQTRSTSRHHLDPSLHNTEVPPAPPPSHYYSDDEEDMDDDSGNNEKAMQSSKSSILSSVCFVRRSTHSRTVATSSASARNNSSPRDPPVATSKHKQRTTNHTRVSQHDRTEHTSVTMIKEESVSSFAAAEEEIEELVLESSKAATKAKLSTIHSYDDESDENVAEDSDEEQIWEDVQQDMMLRMGPGGRVGTIDVRLVGKDLHVLVENADLTLEIVPVEEKDDAEPSDASDSSNAEEVDPKSSQIRSSSKHGGAAETTKASLNRADSSKSKPASKKPTPASNPKTVGERVLAEIGLAKAFSAIPHLLIRDVKVCIAIYEPPSRECYSDKENDQIDESSAEKPSNQPQPSRVVEVGVDFLSVTSGDDALSHFQTQEDNDGESNIDNSSRPLTSIHSFHDGENVAEENEYLFRNIRTGRGPEAGIWVRVLDRTDLISRRVHSKRQRMAEQWPRQVWIRETQYHLFRCSGLDLRARIYMGTKKEAAYYSSWFYADEDDDFTYDDSLDSMLVGIDNIAPGPQLPLPPIAPARMSRGGTPGRRDTFDFDAAADDVDSSSPMHSALEAMKEAAASDSKNSADIFFKDKNGIQSCKVPSSFHRVSRGMVPTRCPSTHLPCETCSKCWRQTLTAEPDTASLDGSTPMPGLVFQLSVRDPIELNMDRSSLDTVGLLQSLFVERKEAQEANNIDNSEKVADKSLADGAVIPDESTEKTDSTRKSYFSGFFSTRLAKTNEEDSEEAFASFMQPEKIQIMGLYVNALRVRFHILRCPQEHRDVGLAFSYWDLSVDCLTVDRQSIASKPKTFQDLRVEVGNLELNERKGCERRRLLSMGKPLRATASGDSLAALLIAEASQYQAAHAESPWPSTASVLLGLPSPLESVVYQSRHHHGIQMRLAAVGDLSDPKATFSRSSLSMKFGATKVDMAFSTKDELRMAQKQAVGCLFRRSDSQDDGGDTIKSTSNESDPSKQTDESKDNSVMSYKVHIDGSDISMTPMIRARLPVTQFSGERSSESGIFLETVLRQISLSHGEQHHEAITPPRPLSFLGIVSLPEALRVRILMYLKDLRPLEKALKIKKQSNTLLRIQAINRAIERETKNMNAARGRATEGGKSTGRDGSQGNEASFDKNDRESLLARIQDLDDHALRKMWSVHERSMKKQAKKPAGTMLR